MKRLAIFASGSGSNAEAIIDYFRNHSSIKIALIVSNRSKAGVLTRAEKFGLPSLVIKRNDFNNSEKLLNELQKYDIDFVVLAGFLLLIPPYLVEAFPNKIVNIHPALLPKYGGQGMYGHHVHEAVEAAKEKESGMTIHFVNENYDEGQIIFQAKTELHPDDNADTIAEKVLKLEHEYYPQVIERVVLGLYPIYSNPPLSGNR